MINLKNSQQLLKIYEDGIILALSHLKYSFEKVKKLSGDPVQMNLEELETWESFVARFARVSDIFLSKYLRLKNLQLDPGLNGVFRDFLDFAEKTALISDAEKWMEIRELRNKISHEYTMTDLQEVFRQVLQFTPFVINELGRILNETDNNSN